jgi:hypothetical protein
MGFWGKAVRLGRIWYWLIPQARFILLAVWKYIIVCLCQECMAIGGVYGVCMFAVLGSREVFLLGGCTNPSPDRSLISSPYTPINIYRHQMNLLSINCFVRQVFESHCTRVRHWVIRVMVKVKVKFTLEQATKTQRESRCVDLLFL